MWRLLGTEIDEKKIDPRRLKIIKILYNLE